MDTKGFPFALRWGESWRFPIDMVASVDSPRGWTLDNGLYHCRNSASKDIVCLAALHMIAAKCYRALRIGQLVSYGRRCSLMPSGVSFRVDVLEFEVVSSWGYHVAFSLSVPGRTRGSAAVAPPLASSSTWSSQQTKR